jgi:hypothetical protein
VHATFVDVARIRADPVVEPIPPNTEETLRPIAGPVPNSTVPPTGTLSDDTVASLVAGPPGAPKSSTPIVTEATSRFVHEKKLRRLAICTMPGTEKTCLVKGAGIGLSTTPAAAGDEIRAKLRERRDRTRPLMRIPPSKLRPGEVFYAAAPRNTPPFG